MTHLIFVYGTLKLGHCNNRLLEDSEFVCEALTSGKFRMHSVGYPLLTEARGEGHRVRGEVFEVTDATLTVLDRLEGHPHHYERRPIHLDAVGNNWNWRGMLVQAYIYGKTPYGEPVEPGIDGTLEWKGGA